MNQTTEIEVIAFLNLITNSHVGRVPKWIEDRATRLSKAINSDNEGSKILNERNSVDYGETICSVEGCNEPGICKGKCGAHCDCLA